MAAVAVPSSGVGAMGRYNLLLAALRGKLIRPGRMGGRSGVIVERVAGFAVAQA